MDWLLPAWEELQQWLPYLLGLLNLLLAVGTITWVLMTKADSTSAVAWCLVTIFLPFIGALLFVLFGYQHVSRPLRRKRRHKLAYRAPVLPAQVTPSGRLVPADVSETEGAVTSGLLRLADRFGAYPLTMGNQVDFYHEGRPAFDAMLEAITAAQHHIHLETFIFQPDDLGKQFLELLTQKARAGVEIRLLYDAMGSHRLSSSLLRALHVAGGKTSTFLPLNPFRRRLQINMRNHRKIMVVDGQVAFVGGLNVGDEYLGKVPRFGFWRDTHLRLQGPAVADLQRVFVEDWDFAAAERIQEKEGTGNYFQPKGPGGPFPVQVIESGPDRELKGIREIYFAAILKARKRLWIASPYFVPDAGLLDALRLAGYLGLDVRFLGQFYPDKWIPQYAARYYWAEVLPAGVKVYQYTKGMMHSKVVLVDDQWASVGTANLDNRSLHLNFEVNCLIYSPQAVALLAEAFERDLSSSIRLERSVYARRPFAGRLLENACRLLSPIL